MRIAHWDGPADDASPACMAGGRCVLVEADGADLEVRAQEQRVDQGGRSADASPVVIPQRGDEP